MGLPGSGKTTLAKEILKILDADWLNADKVRKKYKDWDFSKKGIINQSKRMNILSRKSKKKFIIADFICPYKEGRKIFNPNYLVWVDTIKKSKYKNMNKVFQKPKNFNYKVIDKNAKLHALKIVSKLKNYNWNNKKPTSQMLGRFQPFHDGHLRLFEKIITLTGQVLICVRDVYNTKDNPFKFSVVKKKINSKLIQNYKGRYRIVPISNITEICYGRKVGYRTHKIKLSKKIEQISATNIRKKLRRLGKLKK